MASLAEVLKDKTLPVFITRPSFSLHKYVEVVAVRGEVAVGFFEDGSGAACTGWDDWSLYTEPKKKRILYQALCRGSERLYVSDALFENEEAARVYCPAAFVRLIKERPIEVEES